MNIVTLSLSLSLSLSKCVCVCARAHARERGREVTRIKESASWARTPHSLTRVLVSVKTRSASKNEERQRRADILP